MLYEVKLLEKDGAIVNDYGGMTEFRKDLVGQEQPRVSCFAACSCPLGTKATRRVLGSYKTMTETSFSLPVLNNAAVARQFSNLWPMAYKDRTVSQRKEQPIEGQSDIVMAMSCFRLSASNLSCDKT